METTYYLKVNIEAPLTDLTNGWKSIAGQMWYEIYQKDSSGNISNRIEAGYTGHGVVNSDGRDYAGDPKYSSKEIAISPEHFKTLQDFGQLGKDNTPPILAVQKGFGNNDYNVFTNSCIDYTYKALELIGINKTGYQGNLVPTTNRFEINSLLKNMNIAYHENLNSISINNTPTPQTQTTIYETASRLNTTVSKLEQSNPWLKSRSSDNLSTIFNNSSNKSLLVKDNTGNSYTYTYNSSSDTFENQTPIATADDTINFIANFDGTMSDLQNIQNAVKDAYENHGLSKEYYDAFMEGFNTYVKVNTQNNNVTTQPTGNSTRIDKHAFYYYNNINDTALSLANKTFKVLDSNNNALSVQDLKLLDVNINLATQKILF